MVEGNKKLELRNEKLSDNYGRLINDLIDARKLVSHLQNDLQTEKQDKAHIQKELNDALAILNKPTAEMGTQTDLTAEQITQMEKDLGEKTTKITELAKEQNELTNQITQKETELNQLKKEVKDLKPNETEKRLATISFGIVDDENYAREMFVFLENGRIKEEVWDWNKLKEPYKKMRLNLLMSARFLLRKIELGKNIIKETKIKVQLQTKYDQEVKTKTELVEELRLARKYCSFGLLLRTSNYQEKEVEKLLKQFITQLSYVRIDKEDAKDYDFSFIRSSDLNCILNFQNNLGKIKVVESKWLTPILELKPPSFLRDKHFISNQWSKRKVRKVSEVELNLYTRETEYEVREE